MPTKLITKLTFALIAFLLLIVLPNLADLYTEWLWFNEIGYQFIFLKSLGTKGLLGIVIFAVTFGVLFANLRLALRGLSRSYTVFPGGGDLKPLVLEKRHLRWLVAGISVLLSFFMARIASNQWLVVLQYLQATPFGETDVLFGRDAAFYVFTLPFLDFARYILLGMVAFSFVGSIVAYVISDQVKLNPEGLEITDQPRRHLALLMAGGFLLLAWGAFLDMPRTLTSPAGILHGASYVDVMARLPFLRILMLISILAAGVAAYGAFVSALWPMPLAIAGYLLVWFTGSGAVALFQQLVVTPDEQSKEAPYIANNIAATRLAFGLDQIDERQVFGDALLTLDDIKNNSETLNNVRLWDHLPLLDTFGQIQEIRTYYEFASVDNDRYVVDGEYRQTMVSSRELNSNNLPNRSWINERLQYTHGFGVALGPVNQVTPEGLPVLFVKDLPPRSETDLVLTQPSIYFGELSNDYVIVNTKTDEFHYPEGEDNVSTRYDGAGGLKLGGLFRRLLLSFRFRSYEILVSNQLSANSLVLFHRNISDRVSTIAPFLQYDADPYLVIADGRLFWIRDAYTATAYYPYSTPASRGINYIRNSVKVVIDAYHGTTTFYLAEMDDPIALTLGKVFPDFLQPLDKMPAALLSHLRYPEDIFKLQSDMYSIYHMTNPSVFYNREDEWEVPVIDNEQMAPYYTIMKLPTEERAEFIQMLPFTPRGKNNLAAWMVARSDGEHYGKMLVYKFPKQKVVFGPSQIVARINQDQEISPQITLWNQQGSEVIQGTLLVIPIEESLLYIRPLYLRASGGRIPELKRVIVAYQNQIAMEETLNASLQRIFGTAPVRTSSSPVTLVADLAQTETAAPANIAMADTLALQAQQHYTRALEAQREGNWTRYGEEIDRLGKVLEQM